MCGAADESDHQTEISEHQRDIEWRVWRVDLSEREDLRSWHPAIEMRRQETGETGETGETSECGARAAESANVQERSRIRDRNRIRSCIKPFDRSFQQTFLHKLASHCFQANRTEVIHRRIARWLAVENSSYCTASVPPIQYPMIPSIRILCSPPASRGPVTRHVPLT